MLSDLPLPSEQNDGGSVLNPLATAAILLTVQQKAVAVNLCFSH